MEITVPSITSFSAIVESVSEYNFPVIFNFPAGHLDDNRTLIFGRKVNLEVGKIKSKIAFLQKKIIKP